MPPSWHISKVVYVPKKKGVKTLDQLWLISLLNVDTKIFFRVMAKRLIILFRTGRSISAQNASVSGFAGYLKHTQRLWDLTDFPP